MTTLYHTTSQDNLEDILRDGLRGNPIHLSIEPFIFDSLIEFCHDVPWDEMVTLAVDAKGLLVSPGWDGPESLTSYRGIPSSRLRVIARPAATT